MTLSVLLLGATGSVGKNALSKIKELKCSLEGFSFYNNITEARKIIQEYHPNVVFALNPDYKNILELEFSHLKIYSTINELSSFIQSSDKEFSVINAISGYHGLIPSLDTLISKRTLIIANKESIILGGKYLLKHVQFPNQILPIDSEHFSLFFLLSMIPKQYVSSLLITASGGPFFFRDISTFHSITLEETLKHPVWEMGPSITISSATMANKGLEVIEAKELFGYPMSDIHVLVHPTSFTHAGVTFHNGSFLFHNYPPSMETPIACALKYPETYYSPETTQPQAHQSEFFQVDFEKFPLLKMAYQTEGQSHIYQMIYALGTEMIAELFLKKAIRFQEMPVIMDKFLNSAPLEVVDDINHIIEKIPNIVTYITKISKEYL